MISAAIRLRERAIENQTAAELEVSGTAQIIKSSHVVAKELYDRVESFFEPYMRLLAAGIISFLAREIWEILTRVRIEKIKGE